jgi:hypothetical protein
MVSDLTGKEANEDKFIELVVREAPGLAQPVRLDVLPEEVKNLKSAGEYVLLEVKNNGSSEQLIVSVDEFKKLAPKMDEILANAPGLRGRKPGFKPQG